MIRKGFDMQQERVHAMRFRIGQTVQVTDAIMTVHVGQLGTVIDHQSSRHAHTLDKYVLRFPSGVEKLFWDIQLKRSAA
jgi:hypothetical protein